MNHSKRLSNVAKAGAEFHNLAWSAEHTESGPEAALVQLERRNSATVRMNALLGRALPVAAKTDRKVALWSECSALPVAKQNAFCAEHRSKMSRDAPSYPKMHCGVMP